MLRKIAFGTALAGVALATLPLLAAFEAHVVNVTARIENALSVPVDPIAFGTVFPQEQLERRLPVSLSQSFLDETRVDDVEYIIRQKPKCGVTNEDGTQIVGPTWTGHVVVTGNGSTAPYDYYVDCNADAPKEVVQDPNNPELWLLPSLCEYISKHPDNQPENDGSLNSFHAPFTINQQTGAIEWNDTDGRLAKSELDIQDVWTIDLKVPCFGGYCAQDWADFVDGMKAVGDVVGMNSQHNNSPRFNAFRKDNSGGGATKDFCLIQGLIDCVQRFERIVMDRTKNDGKIDRLLACLQFGLNGGFAGGKCGGGGLAEAYSNMSGHNLINSPRITRKNVLVYILKVFQF